MSFAHVARSERSEQFASLTTPVRVAITHGNFEYVKNANP